MKYGSFFHQRLWVLLIPILLLGGFFRLFRLDAVPAAPYWEEVALGYDAYSIAQTGKDHQGNPFPIVAFPSFGDYKPSGYFYATAPFVKLLGLSVWSVRLPSALAGLLSLVMLYLIGKELVSEKAGLLASLFLAIQPWAIQFSRGGWEVNLALCLLLSGAFALLLARKHPNVLYLAVFFFCLSMYTYHAARLFAPLFGLFGGSVLVVSWMMQLPPAANTSFVGSLLVLLRRRGWVVLGSVLFAVLLVWPLVKNITDKSVSSRFSDTSVFNSLEPILHSNGAIASHGDTRLAKLLYHRYWYFLSLVGSAWLSHVDPMFLFVRGDGNLRHWNGIVGPLYFPDGLVWAVALLLVLVPMRTTMFSRDHLDRKTIGLLLVWIGLAAVPAALVTPAPHALRFLFAAPAFALLTAIGVCRLTWFFGNRRVRAGLLLCLGALYLFCTLRYWSWYQVAYPVQSASDWQYGYKDLYAWLATAKRPGERVYITREQGRPAMYYLFYSQYDPALLQQEVSSLPKDQLELLQVGEYYFVDALASSQFGLIATSRSKVVMGGKIVHTISAPSGETVWVIWRRE